MGVLQRKKSPRSVPDQGADSRSGGGKTVEVSIDEAVGITDDWTVLLSGPAIELGSAEAGRPSDGMTEEEIQEAEEALESASRRLSA
jgi:hypothetical protein